MLRKVGIVLVLTTLAGGLLQADFSYVETTKVTGGSLLKMMRFVPGGTKSLTEPTENAVYLKGNRMANVNKKTADIVDLDKETITHVDFEKKTYSVITFAEMAQLMAEMQKAAQQRMAEAQTKAGRPEDPQAKMDMKVDVKETGATKNVNGLDTREFIMTIETLISGQAQTQQGPAPVGMATKIVSDMWMTPQLPGYEEVLEFQKKVALKLATNTAPSIAPMMFQQRGSTELFKKMGEEGSKLKGTPVLTVTKMMGPGGPGGAGGPGAEGPDMSQAGDAARREAASEAQSEAARQAAMSTGGRLGGLAGATAGGMLGGFGKKKPQPPKEQAPPPSQPQAQPGQLTESVMLETTSEKSGFARGAVPAEKLEVPAGFKQVEPEMKRSLEQMKKGQ